MFCLYVFNCKLTFYLSSGTTQLRLLIPSPPSHSVQCTASKIPARKKAKKDKNKAKKGKIAATLGLAGAKQGTSKTMPEMLSMSCLKMIAAMPKGGMAPL